MPSNTYWTKKFIKLEMGVDFIPKQIKPYIYKTNKLILKFVNF